MPLISADLYYDVQLRARKEAGRRQARQARERDGLALRENGDVLGAAAIRYEKGWE